MRVLTIITFSVCVVAGGACSNLLGIEDPTPDFGGGGDGGPRTLTSIAIGPDPLSLPRGVSEQLVAIGMFSDGSSTDITAQTEFSADGRGAITVTPEGLAHAIAEGSAMVTARLGKVEGSAMAQVGPAVPKRLVFGLGDFKMARGQRVRFHALAVLTDDTMADVTANASYASDPAGVVTVSPGQADGTQAGVATLSASLGMAQAGTVKATVTSKQCQPVINEFQTGSAASADDEWVEILNPCTTTINVSTWNLVYRAATTTGTADSSTLSALAGQMMPGEIRLYAGPAYTGTKDGGWAGGILAQASGAVALRMGPKDTGTIADAVAYGTVTAGHPFIEGKALPAMANDRPAQRQPFDGRDDDDGSVDFMQVTTGTPRAPNAP